MPTQILAFRILALVLFVLATTVSAQEVSPPPEENPVASEGDEVENLLQEVREAEAELHDARMELPETEGEDRALLRSKLYDLGRSQFARLLALQELILKREATGADVSLAAEELEQLLRRFSRRLRSYIEFVEDELVEQAMLRETLEPPELQNFEHEMAERSGLLTEAYLGLVDLTDAMAEAGLSTEDEQTFLAEKLAERGERLFRVMELTAKQIEQYRQVQKNAPDDSNNQARLFAAEERFHSNKTALMATIHLERSLGLDFTDLEVRTLELTGEVTAEALEVEVALGLLARRWQAFKTYLQQNGPSLIVRFLVILGILILFWMFARIVRRLTAKALERSRISTSELLKEMIIKMAGRVVLLLGVILVLGQLGINLGPLLAGLGIAGFIVGFALQDTLSNFAAGAMILAYRPFDVGDIVEAAGVSGRVRDMNLVSTRILTLDHQTLIVPNSKIWGDVIRNVTAQTMRRIDLVFGISYEDDIDEAERVLGEIVQAHEKVLEDPEPVIKLHSLNDSSVDFIVRPWARTDDYWDVYWDITKEVKQRFDREGISIPFPQRDVHLYSESGPNTDS